MSILNKFSVGYGLDHSKRKKKEFHRQNTHYSRKGEGLDVEVAHILTSLGYTLDKLMLLMKVHPFSTSDEALNYLEKDPDTNKYNHKFYKRNNENKCGICEADLSEHIEDYIFDINNENSSIRPMSCYDKSMKISNFNRSGLSSGIYKTNQFFQSDIGQKNNFKTKSTKFNKHKINVGQNQSGIVKKKKEEENKMDNSTSIQQSKYGNECTGINNNSKMISGANDASQTPLNSNNKDPIDLLNKQNDSIIKDEELIKETNNSLYENNYELGKMGIEKVISDNPNVKDGNNTISTNNLMFGGNNNFQCTSVGMSNSQNLNHATDIGINSKDNVEMVNFTSNPVKKISESNIKNKIKIKKVEIPQETLDLFNDPDICRICFSEKVNKENICQKTCGHFFCDVCIKRHIETKIINGQVLSIKCLMGGCPKQYSDDEIQRTIDEKLYYKYIKFKNEQIKLNNPDKHYVHCPHVDCDEIVDCDEAETEFVTCSKGHLFCYKCHKEGKHKPGECEDNELQLLKQIQKENKDGLNFKQCPQCHVIIEKNEGCNQMHCISCGYDFCWLCLKQYTDDHYALYNVRGCPGMRFETDSGSKWTRNSCLKCLWYLFSCILGSFTVLGVVLFYIFFGCAYEFIKCYTKKKKNEDENLFDEEMVNYSRDMSMMYNNEVDISEQPGIVTSNNNIGSTQMQSNTSNHKIGGGNYNNRVNDGNNEQTNNAENIASQGNMNNVFNSNNMNSGVQENNNNTIENNKNNNTQEKPKWKIYLIGFLGVLCQPLYIMFYVLYGLMECYRRFNCWFYYVDY